MIQDSQFKNNCTSKMKCAILVDEDFVNYATFRLINYSQNFEKYYIDKIIVQKMKKKKRYKFSASKIMFNIIYAFEKFLIIKKFNKYSNFFQKFLINKLNIDTIYVNPNRLKRGNYIEYTRRDIDLIKRENFDLLIRCGSGILTGEILKASKFGIISFHHGDNRIIRGGPAGFWEVYFRFPATGFIIQILN